MGRLLQLRVCVLSCLCVYNIKRDLHTGAWYRRACTICFYFKLVIMSVQTKYVIGLRDYFKKNTIQPIRFFFQHIHGAYGQQKMS